MESFSPQLQVSDNAGHYIHATHYNWCSELIKDLYKDFDLDYNEEYDNINYEKNARDKENNDIAKKNDKENSKDSLKDGEDDSVVKEKNEGKSEFNDDNNVSWNPDLKVSVNVIM